LNGPQNVISAFYAIKQFLGRFKAARDGNVALIFALTVLPIICMVGGAIDFSIAASNKTALQDAMDSAALAGAKAASAYIAANGTGSPQVAQAIALGNTAAQNFFTNNSGSIGGQSTPTITTVTTITSGAPTVVMTARSTYSPFLLSIVGINSIPLSVTSTTTMSPSNSYYQIIFVVDISGSMAIGGDPSTITTMMAKGAFNDTTNAPCAFACHDTADLEGEQATNWCDSNPSDYFCQTNGRYYCPFGTGQCPMVNSTTMANHRALAKLYGYNLKIDYINSAIQSFTSQLSTYSSKYPGRYTVGVDTFGTQFNILQAPTTNMSTATSAASSIDVEAITGPVATTNWGYTYTTIGLTNALSHITNMGNGSSATKMLTYVIFLTDGVEDIPGSVMYNRQTDLSYASECTAMKNAGVNMFTIWAPYYVVPGDPQYATLVAPLSANLPTTMQNCASNANQYFQANDGAAITAAVNSTFNTIIANSKLRITN
jgi:Flp pilus assembly protein TadG